MTAEKIDQLPHKFMKSDKLRKEIYKFDLSHNKYRKFMQFSICMLFFYYYHEKKDGP